jgi:hypothetical protein
MQKVPITTKVMSFIHAHDVVYSIELNEIKKSLKISKGKSESVNRRRTDNTMGKIKKDKRTNNDLQSIHIKLKIQ